MKCILALRRTFKLSVCYRSVATTSRLCLRGKFASMLDTTSDDKSLFVQYAAALNKPVDALHFYELLRSHERSSSERISHAGAKEWNARLKRDFTKLSETAPHQFQQLQADTAEFNDLVLKGIFSDISWIPDQPLASAFAYYVRAHTHRLRNEHPELFTDTAEVGRDKVANMLLQEYNQLTPEERSRYETEYREAHDKFEKRTKFLTDDQKMALKFVEQFVQLHYQANKEAVFGMRERWSELDFPGDYTTGYQQFLIACTTDSESGELLSESALSHLHAVGNVEVEKKWEYMSERERTPYEVLARHAAAKYPHRVFKWALHMSITDRQELVDREAPDLIRPLWSASFKRRLYENPDLWPQFKRFLYENYDDWLDEFRNQQPLTEYESFSWSRDQIVARNWQISQMIVDLAVERFEALKFGSTDS